MTLDSPRFLARCPGFDPGPMDPNRNIIIVRKNQLEFLTDKQQLDYYEHRKKCLGWLLRMGKDPEKAKGYSPYTVAGTADRMARCDLWCWENRGGYSIPTTEEDAKAYMEKVAFEDVVESTKGKRMEALLRYNKWLQHRHGADEWEFKWTFKSGGGNTGPRDFLSREERRKIRQAALGKDGNPNYGVENFEEKADSWRYTSLVWTSLDAGLRPIEVGRAKVSWCDTDNGVLRIPREESSKNEGNWTVGLTDRTTTALERWLEERAEHPKYEDSERVWLTRHGNRYGSNQLRRLLVDLCDRAGIEHENRQMSWYTIRHSVGTYMTKERGLAAAKAQLRHRNAKTTMKYDQVPVEDRRDALDKMG
ncbi:tyrosine-type recombinase/integrase [Salinarchaeum laminariae]|uniref:tyrosine-type recombinase/integrase n=1 Tax=Salinarchaeum laminariae TaxID=869888 RepID=UPI0020BE3944|nr:site-specific integrase [Salinarchaeum laminariae]